MILEHKTSSAEQILEMVAMEFGFQAAKEEFVKSL